MRSLLPSPWWGDRTRSTSRPSAGNQSTAGETRHRVFIYPRRWNLGGFYADARTCSGPQLIYRWCCCALSVNMRRVQESLSLSLSWHVRQAEATCDVWPIVSLIFIFLEEKVAAVCLLSSQHLGPAGCEVPPSMAPVPLKTPSTGR